MTMLMFDLPIGRRIAAAVKREFIQSLASSL